MTKADYLRKIASIPLVINYLIENRFENLDKLIDLKREIEAVNDATTLDQLKELYEKYCKLIQDKAITLGGISPLCHICNCSLSKQLTLAQNLLSAGLNPNELDSEGFTPLQIAARHANLALIRMLLSAGAGQTINCRYDNDITALTMLCHAEFKANKATDDILYCIIKLMIDFGADVNAVDFFGRSVLFNMVSCKYIQSAKLLVSSGASKTLVDKFGKSLASVAHSGRDIAMLKLLLGDPLPTWCNFWLRKRYGYEVEVFHPLVSPEKNHSTDECRQLLGYASSLISDLSKNHFHHIAELKLLAENMFKNINEDTHEVYVRPLFKKYLTLLRSSYIRSYDEKENIFDFFIRNGNVENVEHLIQLGFHANFGCYVQQAVSVAGETKSLKLVTLLCEAGADPHRSFISDYSALYQVIEAGHIEILRYFISKGVNINKPDHRGYTPLQVASKYGEHDIIKILLEAGAEASINDKGSHNFTPLNVVSNPHYSSNILGEEHSYRIIKILIEHGADVNITGGMGRTILHNMVSLGYTRSAELLISAGANKTLADINGETPISIAQSRDNKAMLRILNKVSDQALPHIPSEVGVFFSGGQHQLSPQSSEKKQLDAKPT